MLEISYDVLYSMQLIGMGADLMLSILVNMSELWVSGGERPRGGH